MTQKQGGKGKSSSQSDKNYWNRVKLEGGAERRREKRIARHRVRMGLNISQIALATNPPSHRFPHKPRPLEKVVFSGKVPDYADIPLHVVFVAGVLIEISPKQSTAETAFSGKFSHLEASHEILWPTYGRRTLVTSANQR